MTISRLAAGISAVSIVAGLAVVGISPAQARTLSFDERVVAQKAIEQVYWNHRIWPKENPGPKPPLASVMPDAAIRARVEDYLKKSNALERWWRRPVTSEQLQAELDRMSRSTRDGQTLQELYRALGDDALVIAETLARQTLVDRLIRSWYSSDTRFHGGVKSKAERALAKCSDVACMKTLGGAYDETTWKLRVEDANPATDDASDRAVRLDADAWKERLDRVASSLGATAESLPVGRLSGLEETPEAFVVTAVRSQRDGDLATSTVAWPKRTFDSWWSAEKIGTPVELVSDVATYAIASSSGGPCVNDTWADTQDQPDGRYGHTAVWTGTEMIVWGGYSFGSVNSGGRYNPSTDSWTWTSTGANVPAVRVGHRAVWTGTEMIVWGGGSVGALNSGGRYNPSTDSWTPTSTGANVPQARSGMVLVWTGTTMIVWGGSGGSNFNTGGRYDPPTDSWLPTSTGANVPSARSGATAVWSGSQMLVYGGNSGLVQLNGGRYNLATDSWVAMAPPLATLDFAPLGPSVWTGTEMIIWGGTGSTPGAGGRYNPATDSWTQTSMGANTPSFRQDHTLVWTGNEMIVWGGRYTAHEKTGGRYNPSTNTWLSTSIGPNVPAGRELHSAVWTGTEMIVWGGMGDNGLLSSGGRYKPSTDSWVPTQAADHPSTRLYATAVWTGSEMIVWGGNQVIGGSYLNSGHRYSPATNSWTPTSTGSNVPTGRRDHTAVWTGKEMIVWGGGLQASPYTFTGGRYNPTTDSWTATDLGTYVATARKQHTAVWTGTEMIIWGGNTSVTVNTGSRYNPSTDSWVAASTGTNVPQGRLEHAAVWTGTEMVVWGGSRNNVYLNTGGRYTPSTDSWTATAIDANTPTGRLRTTWVWTGTEMIVWGGSDNNNAKNSGGRYNPSTDAWATTSIGANVPSARTSHTAVWTGAEMIIWGGDSAANTGGRYNPSTDGWVATSTGANVPLARSGHLAVWTGREMLIWGAGYLPSPPGIYCACPSGLIVYRDADGDGHGNIAISIPACDGSIPAGYAVEGNDCNDANASIYPGAAESCNGLDDNCDVIVDNAGASLCNDNNVCTNDACNGPSGCAHANNAAPCDDDILCTNGDTCSAGSCVSGPVGTPPEIHGVSAAGHATTTLTWTGLGGGTSYDLATSTIADLATNATSGATCLADDVPVTSFIDTQPNPASGQGYYYLIRANNVCGIGGYGFATSGAERIPTVGCP